MGIETAEAEAARIQRSQRALRESIEETKRLAEEAERLLRQHKQTPNRA